MPKIPPRIQKILWGVGALIVIADVYWGTWYVRDSFVTAILALAFLAVVLIVYDQRQDFFSTVAKPAILGLLEKKTGVNLLKGSDVSKADKDRDWKESK